MKNYHHLTQRERYLIYYYKSIKKKQYEIAFLLGCSASTISREIKRNINTFYNIVKYDYLYADYLARMRRDNKPKRQDFTKEKKSYVISKLRIQHSPDQIVGSMIKDIGKSISIESIYKFIYKDKQEGGFLYTNLRWQNKKRKKRFHGRSRQRLYGSIPRKSIHERANIIEEKSRFGDIEIDTVIGKNHKQALVTLVDRKTKYTWIKKLVFKRSDLLSKAVNKMLNPIKNHIYTITSDNGSEFAAYEKIENKLGIKFYFCDPYSSWQRGLNEHMP